MVYWDVLGTALVGVLFVLLFTRFVLPELVSRVIVVVLQNPGVQSAICDPISACLGESMVANFGAAMVAANTNPEVCITAPNLLFGDEMQHILGSFLAGVSLRDDVKEQTKSLVAQAINSDEVRVGAIRLINEMFQDSEIKQGCKDMVVDGLLDHEVHRATTTAVMSTMREFFEHTRKDEEWHSVRDSIRESVKEILSDEDLYRAVIKGGFGAMKGACIGMVQDPEIRNVMRSAIKETLLDVGLHQATLKGALSSITPNFTVKESVTEWRENVTKRIPSFVELKSAMALEFEKLGSVTSSGLHSLEEDANFTGPNPALAGVEYAPFSASSSPKMKSSTSSRPQVRYAARSNSRFQALHDLSSLVDGDDPMVSLGDSSDGDREIPSPSAASSIGHAKFAGSTNNRRAQNPVARYPTSTRPAQVSGLSGMPLSSFGSISSDARMTAPYAAEQQHSDGSDREVIKRKGESPKSPIPHADAASPLTIPWGRWAMPTQEVPTPMKDTTESRCGVECAYDECSHRTRQNPDEGREQSARSHASPTTTSKGSLMLPTVARTVNTSTRQRGTDYTAQSVNARSALPKKHSIDTGSTTITTTIGDRDAPPTPERGINGDTDGGSPSSWGPEMSTSPRVKLKGLLRQQTLDDDTEP